MTAVVTRFAPSPTGLLHIGGVRTALFSWLYARRMQGQFILRVEDTDLERSTPEAVKVILEGMQWLGLEHDQGPFYQTQRFDRYKEVIARHGEGRHGLPLLLLKEELDAMRADQQSRKEKPRYDGRCRHGKGPGAASGRPPVVRFANPEEGATVVEDVVHGAGHVPEQGARRPHHRALRRHADLQLLRGGRRRRHGCHARDPRRRSPQQHAAADEHAAGARQDAAGVRARADDPGARRRQALQAPRRGERARVPGPGLSTRGAAQLPRAARLVARRPGIFHARGDDRGLRRARHQQVGVGAEPREAAVAQPAAHDQGAAQGHRAAPALAPGAPRRVSRRTMRCSKASSCRSASARRRSRRWRRTAASSSATRSRSTRRPRRNT